ncbi:hypothetical protein B7P33_07240 [Sediminicola luteus]|uniref:HTH araC/xylS-type domain-containing protein n=1 Tax=Sediminicola luteus TaxID=319238 RepID=A0A2A4GAE1_9FLAO|nr:hypothetical protein B7P33_07240 [Sediminicola luteus]
MVCRILSYFCQVKIEYILTLLVCGLGVIHGFMLGVYLLAKKYTTGISHKILGVLLLLFGLRISKSIFLYFTSDLEFILITLGLTLILLLGPLFYLYTRSCLVKDFQIRLKMGLHALPFLIFLVLNSLMLLSKTFYVSFGIYAIYLHFLGYILGSFFLFRKQLKQGVSLGSTKKKWLYAIHFGIVFIWASYFFFLLGEAIPYIMGPLTYSIAIYGLSLWALKHKVFQEDKVKYKGSSMDIVASRSIFEALTTYLEKEKAYLNPDLKLQDIASKLKVSTHALSRSVNENGHQNFQQFLNSYRIQEAKSKLTSNEYRKLTISAIAFDCGFNSISAFNAAFKKVEGRTPSQYRASLAD